MTDTNKKAGDNEAPVERKRIQVYPLIFPFDKKDGSTVTEVTLRRPKGKELRKVDKLSEKDGALSASYQMIAWLSGLDFGDVDEMDGEDVVALSELVTNFLPKPKTGDAS